MTRLSLNDLLPNTNYAIRLRAVSESGVSEWSTRRVFTTISDQIKPALPTNVTWASVGDSFHAEWTAVDLNLNGESIAVTRYEVEVIANSLTRIDSVPAATGISKVTYDLSFEMNRSLFTTPQPTITFRVRAVDNKDLKSEWSPTVALNASNASPQPPTSVTAAAGLDQISLSWTSPSDTDIIGYNVYNTGNTLVGFVNATNYSYITTTYSSQTMKVASVDKFGQVSTLANANAVTPNSPFVVDTTAPAVPVFTSASCNIVNNTNGLGAIANLIWTQTVPAPDDLSGFEIRWRKTGDTVWNSAGSFDKADREAKVSLNSAYSNHDFQIRSFDKQSNYSAWTSILTVTAPVNGAPANVSGFTSTAGRDAIRYDWTAVPDADLKEYEITVSTAADFSVSPLTFKTAGTTMTVSGLTPSTSYSARIRAVDAGGLTSAAWSATNTRSTLSSSSGVAVSDLTGGSFGAIGMTMPAGSSILLNGGHIRSNTYTGTSQASNPSNNGFYLGNDGLRVDSGIISASALVTGTISGTNTITLSGVNARIQSSGYTGVAGSGGFRLSGTGLEIPDGTLSISKVVVGTNSISGSALTSIDGSKITTGSIISTSTAMVTRTRPVYAEDGSITGYGEPTEVPDPNNRRAWSIATDGSAEFSRMSIRGNAVLGNPDTTNASETVNINADITGGSTAITSVNSQFVPSDQGRAISGTGIPAATTIQSVTNKSQAIMSQSATATASNQTFFVVRPIRYVSTVSSANYIPGSIGWSIRSDGFAEFRELAADSVDGGAIIAGTMKVEALTSGTVSADMSLAGSFVTTSEPTTTTFTFSSPSTTINVGSDSTSTFQFKAEDVGLSIVGFGIPANSKVVSFVSATQVTISSTTTVAGTNSVGSVYRGRTVSISGSDGIILSDQYQRPVVTLPTDPAQPAQFTGSLVAEDLYIKDEFRMFGVNNSLGQGAVLNLNGGAYVPSTGPRAAFTWDYSQMSSGDDYKDYRPDQDAFITNPKNLIWDETSKNYYYTFEFYGTQIAKTWGPNNTSFVRDGQVNWGVDMSNVLQGGVSTHARGGMTTNASNFYFLTYNTSSKEWRQQAVSRTGMQRSGGPVAGDLTLNHVWSDVSSHGGLSGQPAMAQYAGVTYIAKRRPTDNKVVMYKYAGIPINTAPTLASAPMVVSGNIQSLTVGKFDFDGVNTYAVVTTTGSGVYRMNYVFRVDAGGFANTNFHFPLAYEESTIGTTWMGTSGDDSASHFRSISTSGKVSSYTALAGALSGTQINTRMRWRNDGTNASFVDSLGVTRGGAAAIGIGSESTSATYTLKRRAKVILSSPTAIPDVGGDSPNSLVFYMGIDSGTRYRYDQLNKGVTMQEIASLRTSDAAGTTVTLKTGVPSKILASGLEINGDGLVKAVRYQESSMISEIRMWATGLPPTGWLVCNGATFSSVDYPVLAARLGNTFGVASGTTYYLPNFNGRVPRMGTPGQMGGSDTVTMPDHTHPVTLTNHTHDGSVLGQAKVNNTTTTGTAGRVTNITGNVGNGGAATVTSGNVSGTNPAISNIPSFLGVTFIIRAL